MKFKKIMLLVSLVLLISSPTFAVETSTAVSTNCEITQKDFLINFTIDSCEYNQAIGEFELNITSEPYSYTKQLIQMAKEKKTEQEIWEAVKKYATPQYKIHTFEIIDKTMIDEKLSNATNVFYYNTYKTKSYQTITYLPEWCEIKREYSGYSDYYNEIAVCEPYMQINSTNALEIGNRLLDYAITNEIGISSKDKKLDYFANEKQDFKLNQKASNRAVTHLGSESAIVQSTVGTQQNISNGLYKWEWDTSTDSGKFWFFDGDDFLNFAFDTNTVGATSAVSAYGDDTSQALNISDIDGTGDWFSLNMTRGLHPFIQIFANDATPKSFTFTHGDLTPTKAYLPGYAYYDSGDNADQVSDLGNNWFLIWDASNGLIFSLTDSADLTAVDDIQVKFDAGETIVYAAGDSNERIYLDWLNTTWADFHTNSDNPTTKYSGKPVSYYEVINESFDSGTYANTTLFNSAQDRCMINTSGGAQVLNKSLGNPCAAWHVANSSIGFELEWRAMYPLQGGGNVPLIGLTKTGFVRAVEVTYNTDSAVACRFPLDNTTIITQDISAHVGNGTWHTFKIIQPNDSHQEVWVDGSQRCKNIQDSITGSFAFNTGANKNSPIYIDWVRIYREVIPDMIDGQGGEYQDFDFSAATLGFNNSLGEWFGKSSLLLPTFTYQENGTINGTYALATNDFYTLHDMSENYVIQMGKIADGTDSEDYTFKPRFNMSIGTGSNDTFLIHNLTTLSILFLGKMGITINDPQAIVYLTNNNTVNFTTATNWFAGTDCWRQLDSGGWTFIGNITNNTQSISYFQDNVTQSQVFDIQCDEEGNVTQSVTYTQDLFRIGREKFYTVNISEGNSSTYEAEFIVNTGLMENVNATFWWDNVQYAYDTFTSAASGLIIGGTNYTFTRLHTVPITYISNPIIGYFWNSTSTYRSNSSEVLNRTLNHTYTIQTLDFDDCSTHSSVVLNITTFDEKDFSIVNSNVDITINATLINGSYKPINITITNSSYVHEICSGVDGQAINTTSQYEYYDGVGGVYTKRLYYLVNLLLDSDTLQYVDNYMLKEANAVSITVTVEDGSGQEQPELYVELQRYYPGFNFFKTVQVSLTGTDGIATFYLEPSDLQDYAEYYFVVKDVTDELKTYGPKAILSTDTEITIIITEEGSFLFSESIVGITTGFNVNTVTNVSSITFSSDSNTAKTYRYLIQQINVTHDTTLCDNSTTTTGATFVCYLGNLDSNIFHITGYTSSGETTIVSFTYTYTGEADYKPGFIGLLVSIIIFMFITFAFMTMNDSVPPLIGGIISLVFIGALDLVPLPKVTLSLLSLYLLTLVIVTYKRQR